MGRKSREVMAAARASLDAKYREHGRLTRPCQAYSALKLGRCEVLTEKTVVWPGQDPIPACSLRCATTIADDHFADARWG